MRQSNVAEEQGGPVRTRVRVGFGMRRWDGTTKMRSRAGGEGRDSKGARKKKKSSVRGVGQPTSIVARCTIHWLRRGETNVHTLL